MVSSWGSYSEPRVLRVPLAEILTIACQAGGKMSKLTGWKKAEIVLKVHRPELLADLPTGKHGRGRLQVHRADREAAQQLVESIHNTPVPVPAPSDSDRFRLPAPPADPKRVGRQLVAPAAGLLLTAAGTLLTAGMLVTWVVTDLSKTHHWDAVHHGSMLGAGALLALVAALIMAGAARMMAGRNTYLLCVIAAILAVVPWSPAWVIGLPSGIWALVVLGRPEVVAAFLEKRRGAPPAPAPVPAEAPRPTGPVAGKVRSWLRSFAGYFLTFPGARRQGTGKGGE